MSKMSIAQAAEHFKISKEAIHNRIRRGSLESIVENGMKYVIFDKHTTLPPKQKKQPSSLDNKYYQLLEQQNLQLQQKVQNLENETRSLRDQKEQMLLNERKMIEQIYKEKDEQLKNILTSFQTKLMLESTHNTDEHLEVEIEEVSQIKKSLDHKNIISLKKYIKQKKITLKKAQKLKKKLKKRAKKDNRIIMIGKKIYLDLQKYDYKDLLPN